MTFQVSICIAYLLFVVTFLLPITRHFVSTSPARGEVRKTLYPAMRIMVQIKATLVLKKILAYIEVREFSE